MDYFVWGYLQDVINSSHCQSIEELKHRLIVAWGNLDLDKVHAGSILTLNIGLGYAANSAFFYIVIHKY